MGAIQTGDVINLDLPRIGYTAGQIGCRARQGNVVEINAGGERNRAGVVVDVIALDALVHQAVTATNDGLAIAVQVVSKANARPEVLPGVIHAALGNSLAAGSDAIGVEKSWQSGIRT